METTTHYGLQKPDPNDTYNKATDNSNMDAIDAQMYQNAQNGIPYGVDSSAAANAITANVTPAPTAYVDGYSVRVKVANTTTGATTLNLNGLGAVSVKNADGTAAGAGDLQAGIPRIFTYVGGASPAFIASGSGGLSGSGNATAADVLAPNTFTSASGKAQEGTMPNNGGVVLTPSGTGEVDIPAGYHDGTGYVQQVNVPAADVLTGTTIAGVAGTMPENGALGTITPGTAAQAIPAGHTTGGQVAGDANLVIGNIKAGISIFGVAGKSSVVDTGDATATAAQILTGQSAYVNGSKITGSIPSVAGGNVITPGTAAQTAIAATTYAQAAIQVAGDPDLTAANILSGASIFGVSGSVVPKKTASGSATSTVSKSVKSAGGATYGNMSVVTVTGLAFQPQIVFLIQANSPSLVIVFWGQANAFSLTDPLAQVMDTFNGSALQLDGTSLYVNSTSFQLPVLNASTPYNWYAWG